MPTDPKTFDAAPTYLSGGDPAGRFTDYHPAWLDNLAGTPYAAYLLPVSPEMPIGQGGSS